MAILKFRVTIILLLFLAQTLVTRALKLILPLKFIINLSCLMSGENKPTDQLQERLDKLNKELSRIPYIDLIEEKIKIKPIFLLLGLLCLFVTLVAFDFPFSGMII